MTIETKIAGLHTRIAGDGPPVVWIHGFPLSSRIFDGQLSIPARHILPDLPGFGASPAGEGVVTIDDYTAAVLQILDAAGVHQAVVAGISMGGYIALALARTAMERLCGLVLIDTRETADTPEAKAKRYVTADEVRQGGTAGVVESMFPKMLTQKTRTSDPENSERLRRIMESASPEGVIAASGAMAERKSSEELLPSIEVPTLVVVGAEDAITPPSDAERMRAAIPGAELAIIENAAHLSNFERPAEFNEIMQRFLDRTEPRR
ncbi:MAG TPA: alpha/beta fold hydrolase [Thermoanaerobaculia bacterium]|nr:alpha/beta fold hydrolase [Thermoanaerobaculia bacterium]